MADYANFKVAGTSLPLPNPGVNTLLRDADPAIFFALDFWAFVITTYVGPRLMTAVAGTTANIQYPVAQKYPYNPTPEMFETQIGFPLLAVYRKRTTYARKTAGWQDDVCTFELVYVLPPLSASQCEQILPIMRDVEMTITRKTTQGFDPAYTPPGGTLGQQPWTLSLAGLERIEFTDGEHGAFEGTGNMYFPCLRMRGSFVERDMYVPAATKFAGGDITATLVASDGTAISNFDQASTQQAPTLTSLGVTSGTQNGGTTVGVTGTLFLNGARVLFGSTPATGVVWNSATSLTCVTPAVSGTGVVSVSVLNPDGQSVVKPTAYTFI